MHAKIDHNDLLDRMNKMGYVRVSCLPSYTNHEGAYHVHHVHDR